MKNLKSIEVKSSLSLPGGERYILVGAVIHQGSSANGGHYVAVAKCPDGTIKEFNDSTVRIYLISVLMFPMCVLGTTLPSYVLLGLQVTKIANFEGRMKFHRKDVYILFYESVNFKYSVPTNNEVK